MFFLTGSLQKSGVMAAMGPGGVSMVQRLAALRLAVMVMALLLSGCGGRRSAEPAQELGRETPSTTWPTFVPSQRCVGSGSVEQRTAVYGEMAGVDADLLSLDVYEPIRPEGCPPAPVMVYVHGGGWRRGDKANQVDDKVDWFTSAGWVLVSVNYRLSPVAIPADSAELDPERVRYPDHNEDVAAAVAWVYAHAPEIGADTDAVSLMGHSAGATIAASIAVDERYLEAFGLAPDALGCVIALDSAAFDMRERVERGANPELYLNAFGTEPVVWDDASPTNHVAAGEEFPAFLAVVRGTSGRVASAGAFVDLVRAAGADGELLHARGLDHAGVNEVVGDPADAVVTPTLERFLDRCTKD